MTILVLNAGSSSLKYQLFAFKADGTHEVLSKGGVERIGLAGSFVAHKGRGGAEIRIDGDIAGHTDALKKVFAALCDKDCGVISGVGDISAFGHRILHGGEDFSSSVILTEENLEKCAKNIDLGPLHMPANLACVEACKKLKSDIPNVGVFDTAFHSTMSKTAYMYAVPYSYYTDYKIRRYGFHGTSHRYVSGQAADYLKKAGCKTSRIVTCHLGNGSSVAAVKDGKAADTSMGLTPLEGLVMGTRSGDIDPAVIEFISRKTGESISEILTVLNKKSGVLGISGVSSDFRDISAAAAAGNERAELALSVFAYHVKKYIGSYAAVLNGLDAVVFTGGVGENSADMRARITKDLDGIGIRLDEAANKSIARGVLSEISKAGEAVRILVIPTDEELVIAKETYELVGGCA
ncbi:MAG: acetate kinase [Clostridiales bacterium]|jgi:acetate kinase|nr:acetate kinase [Clostridiales bacterium]